MKKSNEQFLTEVYHLVKNEYTFLEEYINYNTHILCRHNKCNHKYNVTPNTFFKGKRCPKCYGTPKKSNDEFLKEVYDLVGSEYEFLEKYTTNLVPILCRHNKCGYEWNVIPVHFLRGRRCPKCKGGIKISNEDFIQLVKNLVGNEYIFLEKYKSTHHKILCMHNKCNHEWKIKPNDFQQGKRCPKCSLLNKESKKVKFIKDLLRAKNIEFFQEKTFNECKRINLLPFDFAIKSDRYKYILIEYDGIQHFNGWNKNSESLKIIQERDNIKTQFCKENNYPLLRLNYKNSFIQIINKVNKFLKIYKGNF